MPSRRDQEHDLPLLYDGTPLARAEDEYTVPGARLTPIAPNSGSTLARLVVLVGDRAGRRFTLSSETLIGRSTDASIHIDDSRVSRHHAVVRPLEDGGYELEDLGSSNGTLVNGERVERCKLSFGDRLQFGAQVLLFTHHDPLADQILMRQRLEAIGRMGAGIAHDFNNLLSVVVASLDFIDALPSHRLPNDGEVLACLEDIRNASTRATELTGRLLVYSRQDRAEYSVVDISLLCHEVTKLVSRTSDQSIDIDTDIRPNLVVKGHAGELHQVLMNLCLNARDAMIEGGKLTVKAEPASQTQLTEVSLNRRSPHVVLKIQDTGEGMDEETRQHIFEPFYSTKKQGSGAGLGLATVYEIVNAHGGEVTVRSKQGEGTTFDVFLPALDRTTRSARLAATTVKGGLPTVGGARREGGGILLADDEALVRRSLGRLLIQAGYSVYMARDGEEAVDYVRQNHDQLNLIILDIDMPRLDGVGALEQIRHFSPDINVICISGHHDKATADRLTELKVISFLEKPCETERLLKLAALCMS